MEYKVTDDSGIIGLVDPDAYQTFVDRDWEYDQLVDHFVSQMEMYRALIWGTGMENEWSVSVYKGPPLIEGFRSVKGYIRCSLGRLLVLSYDDLTYAAQFQDETIPTDHQKDYIITIKPGFYRFTIVQSSDHDAEMSNFTTPDYHLCFEPVAQPEYPWSMIVWE